MVKVSFLDTFTEASRPAELCVVGLWQAVKCVWTSEQSSTYSTPLQLCANERCVCVCVCVCPCVWLLQRAVALTDTPLCLK